jgi:glycosyltransferase involved in cell wall biosynthesis
VWPEVRQRVPDATLTIVGFQPGDDTRALAAAPGMSLVANLPDLRDEVRRHAVAVLPFVSGAGIKNKLLEAAAMGMPIVCTPNGALGLRGTPPLAIARSPRAFADALIDLWHDDARRAELGAAARAWVVKHHTWLAVAREAMARLAGTRADAQKAAAADR